MHILLPNSIKGTCCHCGVRNFALDSHLRESASQSANKPHVWVCGRKGFRKNYVTENQKYVVRCLSRVWLKTRKEDWNDFQFYACTTLDSKLKSMSLWDIIYQLLQFTYLFFFARWFNNQHFWMDTIPKQHDTYVPFSRVLEKQ